MLERRICSHDDYDERAPTGAIVGILAAMIYGAIVGAALASLFWWLAA